MSTSSQNLTSYESLALAGPLNLSDGHPRQAPTESQAAILDQMTPLYRGAGHSTFEKVETHAHERFFSALGQKSAPIGTGRVLSCYSSSVAVDIFARALRDRTDRVGLLHPTFDNIPDLLRAWGHNLVPVAETALSAHDDSVFDGDIGCVFVTTPNNPTGWVMLPETMRWLARECSARGVVLALDTSFRGFDTRAWYDHYAILEESEVDHVVIEDSGKLWPTQELKAGFLVAGAGDLPLVDAFSDVLLTISPFVLALLGEFAADAADGGFARLHAMVSEHRVFVRNALAELNLPAPPDPESRVSVERVALPPGVSAGEAYTALSDMDVHVLPCGPFHWDEPGEGDSFIRLSLARDTEMLRQAVTRTASWLAQARASVGRPA
ncbi:aminotransferase class I/II-fold pyridoxal phosphate-dependent enzyme [Saccharothrix deserti]|uniref:aminotransferase class I/II-fold pyridoxal phosphate-dependent enzyme n=1 Tax=Saccharothrix deserti TaxID=2593674 RepID=UPI00192E753C|nr:aminotransferase class I/II-fold pyridoxal phosphate-dependent enzyme [Saccharothrix deserti]